MNSSQPRLYIDRCAIQATEQSLEDLTSTNEIIQQASVYSGIQVSGHPTMRPFPLCDTIQPKLVAWMSKQKQVSPDPIPCLRLRP